MAAVVTTMGQVTSYAKDGPGLAMDTVDASERNPSLRNLAFFFRGFQEFQSVTWW